jgi:hypothetical protein
MNGGRESVARVKADCRTTGSDIGVHMTYGAPNASSVAPQLGRTVPQESATETGALRTRFAVTAPQHVHRADSPIVVHRTQLDPTPMLQYVWPRHQRDVVVVNHVEIMTV